MAPVRSMVPAGSRPGRACCRGRPLDGRAAEAQRAGLRVRVPARVPSGNEPVQPTEGISSPFGFVNGEYVFELGGSGHDGAPHWNSTILSHAFYLAIEGGTHRTSGITVDGVGGERRPEIERIFFRAMTHLMSAARSFRIAAAVIRQSAADLAASSDAERAVDEALRAVGLAPEAFRSKVRWSGGDARVEIQAGASPGGSAGVVAKTEIGELGCQLGCQTAFSPTAGSRFCL